MAAAAFLAGSRHQSAVTRVETTDQPPRTLWIARHTRTVVAGMSIWSTPSAELVYAAGNSARVISRGGKFVGALQGAVCKP
jgi:hypothetical protein